MVCSNYAESHTIYIVKHIPTVGHNQNNLEYHWSKSKNKTGIWREEVSNPRSYSQVSGRADIETQNDSLLIALSHTPRIDILSFKVSCEICKQKTINVVYSIK